jgi:hypothetical protein
MLAGYHRARLKRPGESTSASTSANPKELTILFGGDRNVDEANDETQALIKHWNLLLVERGVWPKQRIEPSIRIRNPSVNSIGTRGKVIARLFSN